MENNNRNLVPMDTQAPGFLVYHASFRAFTRFKEPSSYQYHYMIFKGNFRMISSN